MRKLFVRYLRVRIPRKAKYGSSPGVRDSYGPTRFDLIPPPRSTDHLLLAYFSRQDVEILLVSGNPGVAL